MAAEMATEAPEAKEAVTVALQTVGASEASEAAAAEAAAIDTLMHLTFLRSIMGDGNCWGYGPLDGVGLLDHGREGEVQATPTDADLERLQRLRKRIVALLLSEEGSGLRLDNNLELPRDKKVITAMMQGPKYVNGKVERYAHWSGKMGPVYLAATAKAMGIDIFSRHPTSTAAAYWHDGNYWTVDGSGRRHPKRMTVADVVGRLREPSSVPLVVLEYNGTNHFSSRRTREPPVYNVPGWLILDGAVSMLRKPPAPSR